VNAKRRRRGGQPGPERQKHSKVAHSQENQKVQQERGVVERMSEEPSKY